MRYLPDGIEGQGRDGVAEGRDGKLWPVPHLIKMGIGDAVMLHHACPHSASWNLWSQPRVMVYLYVQSRHSQGCRMLLPAIAYLTLLYVDTYSQPAHARRKARR